MPNKTLDMGHVHAPPPADLSAWACRPGGGAADQTAHELRLELERSTVNIEKSVNGRFDHLSSRMDQMSNSVDYRIDARFRGLLAIGTIFAAMLGLVGYLGLKDRIGDLVEKQFSQAVKADLAAMTKNAKEAADDIALARATARNNPTIVLLTDYGHGSVAMARLKGQILSRNPDARIDVLSADVKRYDIRDAAWTLLRSSSFYPRGTLFVCVVSPGTIDSGGIGATPMALRTKRDQIFIGPDNGTFDLVVRRDEYESSYLINRDELLDERPELLGRVDIFGSTAAFLSSGHSLTEVGKERAGYRFKLGNVRFRELDSSVQGTVMEVDRFGNLTTNIPLSSLEKLERRIGSSLDVRIGARSAPVLVKGVPIVQTYSDVGSGDPLALISYGYLRLSINLGSFAETYGVVAGTDIECMPPERGDL